MKGIILAAGRGSRMRGATQDKPKCMTLLAGKALLQWQIEALQAAGVDDIAVVCGYKAEVIAAAPFSFTQILNPDWETTNMVSSLLRAQAWAGGEDCIISYSDIVYAPSHVAALRQNREPIALTYDTAWRALWEERFADPLADAETFREENGRLLEIGNKTDNIEEIQGQYMGLLKLGRSGWEAIALTCAELGEGVAKTDMTTLLKLLLSKNTAIAAIAVNGAWCEVDSESDAARYEQSLQNQHWHHDWREKDKR